MLIPKLITSLREGYSRELFFKDLVAGIVVGIVALPLAIAFGIASGVTPEQGLITAIIGGFLVSALSGSRVQIGGPTGAFIVIVYGIVQKYGYDALAAATIIAGLLLILMGAMKLGGVIKFIPYPVTVGFTTGIALIIAAGQVRDFMGLRMETVPAEFIEKIEAYASHITTFSPLALGVGLLTILIVVYWPKITHRLPGSLIAILVSTALVHGLDLSVETIGTRFGAVSTALPALRLPSISWSHFRDMVSPAISIALLAGIESLLSAVVADGMTGRRHRSNMELIAQGAANIASPIFGGIPVTGAIARTATNIKNGGQTPFAGIIHAVTLLLIMLFFGKWAALIPMATLGGILLVVAYNMSEWHAFAHLFKSTKSDISILVSTFLLTVLIDLTVAIQVGVVLAALLFMRRMAQDARVGYVTPMLRDDDDEDQEAEVLKKRTVPAGVEIFEISGPFFFGAADKFKHTLSLIQRKPKVLILRLDAVLSLDASGLRALEEVFTQTLREGTHIILSGVSTQPRSVMSRYGLLDKIGRENVLDNIDDALGKAHKYVNVKKKEAPLESQPV